MRHRFLASAVLAAAALASQPALAHVGAPGHDHGFASGFTHPLFGWDHVVAMIGVGLWAAVVGGRAVWLLPVTFPLVMAMGAAFALAGLPLPAVEIGIALSAVVIGALVLTRARPTLGLAVALVAAFAVFHGYAHGAEVPAAAEPALYAAGFVLATALLHAVGLGFGGALRHPLGVMLVRGGGAAISLAGLAFLVGAA